MREYPLPLLRRHGIQLRQPFTHALLGWLRKLAESGLALQRLLLLLERKATVLVHPLSQMLALRPIGAGHIGTGYVRSYGSI